MADMDRMVRLGDLVGTAEIAEHLEVSVRTVQAWHYRYAESFPRALQLSAGLVWVWPDVVDWVWAHRPDLRPRLRADAADDGHRRPLLDGHRG